MNKLPNDIVNYIHFLIYNDNLSKLLSELMSWYNPFEFGAFTKERFFLLRSNGKSRSFKSTAIMNIRKYFLHYNSNMDLSFVIKRQNRATFDFNKSIN